MFIPLGTDRPQQRPVLVNHAVIAVNIVVHLALNAVRARDPQSADGVLAACLFDPKSPLSTGLLTYAFLHADWFHLLGNMAFLWVFGPAVEDRLGRAGYLAYYLAGAVAAALAQYLFDPAPMVGASGAIAAVAGAFMVLFPRTNVRVVLFFFLIGAYSIPSLWFVAGSIAKDLWLLGLGDSGVAYQAHLGGYAFGIGLAMLLLATGALRREEWDLYYAIKQHRRRRELLAATRGLARDPIPARVARSSLRTPAPTPADRASRHDHPALTQPQSLERAAVASAMAAGDLTAAAQRYAALLAQWPRQPGPPPSASLSRRQMLEMAGAMVQAERHADAADVYALFLRTFPHDKEQPRVCLLLAVIALRRLQDHALAARALASISQTLQDPDQHAMAVQIMAETQRAQALAVSQAATSTPATTPSTPTSSATPPVPPAPPDPGRA